MSAHGAARWTPLVLLVACTEPTVTLPEAWNTLKHRQVTVDVYAPIAAPLDIVKLLSGLDGSPIGLDDGAPDLTGAWWDRPSGTEERDGAHVDVVRIPAEPCALTLDQLFPSPATPAADALATWQSQVDAAEGVRGDLIIWQAAFATESACGPGATARAAALANHGPWPAAVVRGLAARPAVGAVELLDAETLAQEGGLDLFAALAAAVRAHDASILIAGGGFVVAPLAADAEPPSEVADFITTVALGPIPLDVLTFAVTADTPALIAATAQALRKALDDAGLDEVELGLSRFGPTPPADLDPRLVPAHRGAFEMAARMALQDVAGLRWAISDRGSAPGPYFDADGTPNAAFMARFPLRQLEGKARVASTGAPDVATMALVEPGGGRTLHVLVAAWDVSQGVGALDYELYVPGFVPPAIERIDYRHAELDQDNRALGSFFFSDIGSLRPDPATGDVLLTYRLPVPGVHYLEIERPAATP